MEANKAKTKYNAKVLAKHMNIMSARSNRSIHDSTF